MAVSVLDAVTTSSSSTYSLAPSAGTDRIAFVAIYQSQTAGSAALDIPTNVQLGGQAMTEVISTPAPNTGFNTSVWAINDSQIASMVGSSLSFSQDPDVNNNTVAGFVIAGANQVLTPNDSFAEYMQFGSADEPFSQDIATVDDGIVVSAMGTEEGTTLQSSTPTERATTGINNHQGHFLYDLTATGTATYTGRADLTAAENHIGTIFSWGPASGGGGGSTYSLIAKQYYSHLLGSTE